MYKKNHDKATQGNKEEQEERLKAALKANLVRRKAQARAKAADQQANEKD